MTMLANVNYQEILKVMRQFKHYSVLAHLDLIIRYDKNGVLPSLPKR